MTASTPAVPVHFLARGRAGIVILGLLAMFGPLSIDLYLPSLPTIGRELGAPENVIQLTLTAFFAGFAIGMPVYGPISDAWGRRPVILVGIGIFIAASLACALSDDARLLVGLRFIQALGAGASVVLARVIIRDIFPLERQARMISLVALVTALTPLLAPLIGSQLLALAGWRSSFAGLALFGAALFGLTWLFVAESHPVAKRGDLKLGAAFLAYGSILRNRSMWGSVLCVGGAMAAMFAYIAGTPFVYIEYFGISPEWYGALFGLNIASQMTFTWTNARLVSRFGAARISRSAAMIGLSGGSALLFFGVTGLTGLWGIAVALLPIIGVTVVQVSNNTVMVMAAFPRNAGAAAGLLTALMFACGALASMVVSLTHGGGPAAMCGVIFVCCVVSAVGTSGVFRRPASVV